MLILGGSATQAALRIRGAGGSRTQTSCCPRCSWRCLGAGQIWRRARPLTSTACLARWPLCNTSLHALCISFVLSVFHILLCKSWEAAAARLAWRDVDEAPQKWMCYLKYARAVVRYEGRVGQDSMGCVAACSLDCQILNWDEPVDSIVRKCP